MKKKVTTEAETKITGKKAIRGRAIWLAFMKLCKPVRTVLIGILGAAFFIIHCLVVEFRSRTSKVYGLQVRVWSSGWQITWPAACATYMLVMHSAHCYLHCFLTGGQVERLKTQIEVMCHSHIFRSLADIWCSLTLAVSAWLKLALDISWAGSVYPVNRGPSIHLLARTGAIINRVMQV